MTPQLFSRYWSAQDGRPFDLDPIFERRDSLVAGSVVHKLFVRLSIPAFANSANGNDSDLTGIHQERITRGQPSKCLTETRWPTRHGNPFLEEDRKAMIAVH